jgi:hypothetical protein
MFAILHALGMFVADLFAKLRKADLKRGQRSIGLLTHTAFS